MKNNLILFTVSLAIALLVAEIFFRYNGKYATYPEINGQGGYYSQFIAPSDSWYYLHTPGAAIEVSKAEFSYSWRANNEGVHDIDFVTPKPDSTYRIFVFGDSFTEGVGSSGDSSYPKQLQALLRSNLHKQVQVFNCGVNGSDPLYGYWFLKGRLQKYKPDMILVNINQTDVVDCVIRGGFERFKQDSTVAYNKPPWFESLYARSFLVRRIVHDMFKYDWSMVSPAKQAIVNQTALQNLTAAVDSFNTFCSINKVAFVACFHPLKNELEWKMPRRAEPVKAYCLNKGIPVADVDEYFAKNHIGSADAPVLYWQKDMHFNNTGYSYMAAALLPVVTSQMQVTQP